MASYFKELNNNERTIIFAAFTAEEVGGYGARYFSENFNSDQVVEMFNIEMISTEGEWGKNSCYITGFEKSDFGTILQSNLKKIDLNFYTNPYPTENLFYRSENARYAKLGVWAHAVSTSKMDSEPNYLKKSDEVATLDLADMTQVIKFIGLSSLSIVNGKDTPTRFEKK